MAQNAFIGRRFADDAELGLSRRRIQAAVRVSRQSGGESPRRLACGFAAAPLAAWHAGIRELEVLRMTKLEELEVAIASLSDEEYREFRGWFLERDWEKWDGQIEKDSNGGKLDFLVKEARDAKQGGHLKDL